MWNELSMADRAKYIKLAVVNGITDLSQIRDTYNSYADGGDMSNTIALDGVVVKTDKHYTEDMVGDTVRFYYSSDPNNYRDFSKKDFENYMAKYGYTWDQYIEPKIVDPIDFVTPQELPEVTVVAKRNTTEKKIASILNNSSPNINRNLTPFEKYMNDAIADKKIANDAFKDEYYKINGITGILDASMRSWQNHGDYLKKWHDPWNNGIDMTREFVGDAGWFIPGISQAYTYDNMMKNAETSRDMGAPLYKTVLGMIKDGATGKLGDIIQLGETLYNPTPENLSNFTYKTKSRNKSSLNYNVPQKQANRTNYALTGYLYDLLHPKETLEAIKDGTYLPFMSGKKKRAYIDKVQETIQNSVLPAAKNRFVTKQMTLSKKFNLPEVDEYSLDIPQVTVGDIGFLRSYKGLSKSSVGHLGNDGEILVGINSNNAHVLDPLEVTLGIASHEYDHVSQGLLGFNNTVPLNRDYLTLLGYDKNVTGVRGPIVEIDYDEGNYYGVPQSNLLKKNQNLYIPYYKHVLNTPVEFNVLAERNSNYTWNSSPNEVISEVSNFIDQNPNLVGKTFNELNNSEQVTVINAVARRFNLSFTEALNMLNKATEDGYLAKGGKLHLNK